MKQRTMISKLSQFKRSLLILKLFMVLCLAVWTPLSEARADNGGQKNLVEGIHLKKKLTYEGVCSTATCYNPMMQMIQELDHKVRPCDNFHQFVCGGFSNSLNVFHLEHNRTLDINSTTSDIFLKQLAAALEEPIIPEELNTFKIAKKLYEACLNKPSFESGGKASLLTLLRSLGGWPVLEGTNWNETNFNWADTIINLNRHGFTSGYLLDFSVDVDLKNNAKRVIYVKPADPGMSREYFATANISMISSYFSYMIKIAVMLGAEHAEAVKQLRNSFKFETMFANLPMPHHEIFSNKDIDIEKKRFYHQTTVVSLTTEFHGIPWKRLLENLFPRMQISDSTRIIVTAPEFIADLNHLISQDLNRKKYAGKRILANYLIWRAVLDSFEYMNNYAFDDKEKPKWEQCALEIAMDHYMSVEALYVRKYGYEKKKHLAQQMMTEIREQYVDVIKKVDWTSDTKSRALKLINTVSSNIGFPDLYSNDSELERIHRNVILSSNDYLLISLQLAAAEQTYLFNQLNRPVNEGNWGTANDGLFSLKPWYSKTRNRIWIPFRVLENDSIAENRPAFMNYARAGFAIGYAIVQVLDFSNFGTTITERENYMSTIECSIEQSRASGIVKRFGVELSSSGSVDSTLMDTAGIRLAYFAYRNRTIPNSVEWTLSVEDRFGPVQMFWINFANMFCSKSNSRHTTYEELFWNRKNQELRIDKCLSNAPEFPKSFDCNPSAYMNPRKKCTYW